MAAHRYWRLKNRATNSGQIGMGQIIMAAVPAGAQQCVGGAPFASGTYGGSLDTSKSFTGNAGDNWFQSGGQNYDGGWIGYDFGAGNDKNIVEVRVSGAPSDYASQMNIWDVESSDDNVTYNFEWTCYHEGWNDGAVYTTFTKPTAGSSARFWAILVSATINGNLDLVLSELHFHETIGGGNVAPTDANYFPRNGSYPIGNAHDNDLSTIIYAGVSNRGVLVWYDFGVDKSIAQIEISSSDAGGGNNARCVSTAYILYSEDGRAWLRGSSIEAQAAWGSEETREFALVPPPPAMQLSEARTFSIITGTAADETLSSGRVFGIYNFPTPYVHDSGGRVLLAVVKAVEMELSQARIFAVVRGRVANPALRMWTGTLDGHDFVFLRLGDTVTLVYDLYSEQWVEWTSPQSGAWRPNVGMTWVGGAALADTYGSSIVAGDDTFGLLWILDPELPWDENPDPLRTPQEIAFDRIVTAQALASGRNYIPCYAIFLDGDNYGLTGAEFTPTILLEYSDDQGRTFISAESLGVETDTTVDNPYSWYSLGQINSPGRIFRWTDNGVLTRIDSASMNDDG